MARAKLVSVITVSDLDFGGILEYNYMIVKGIISVIVLLVLISQFIIKIVLAKISKLHLQNLLYVIESYSKIRGSLVLKVLYLLSVCLSLPT